MDGHNHLHGAKIINMEPDTDLRVINTRCHGMGLSLDYI